MEEGDQASRTGRHDGRQQLDPSHPHDATEFGGSPSHEEGRREGRRLGSQKRPHHLELQNNVRNVYCRALLYPGTDTQALVPVPVPVLAATDDQTIDAVENNAEILEWYQSLPD